MANRILRPCLQSRALVYDLEVAQVTIQKTSKLKDDPHKYWQLPLNESAGEDLDCWDVFMDRNGETTWVQKPGTIPKDGYFIARLNLRTLGVKGRFFRRHGKLQTIYILKPEDS
ncbi:hypothetical protein F4774DRAFT_205619 [Daldinia eschscholtzii]|nr:hypothetical protein F4774DRAFT_205619 [Daldinia eschscholtzii]